MPVLNPRWDPFFELAPVEEIAFGQYHDAARTCEVVGVVVERSPDLGGVLSHELVPRCHENGQGICLFAHKLHESLVVFLVVKVVVVASRRIEEHDLVIHVREQ